MKISANCILVAAITIGFLTVAGATMNPSDARAEEAKGNLSACDSLAPTDKCRMVLSDEWDRNMPEYGHIHNYVVIQKKECEEMVRKWKECKASPGSR